VDGFGKVVRSARQARGWTQGDLARRVGVSQRAVSSWERAVSEPGEHVKGRVAAVLGLPPDAVGPGAGVRRGRSRRYPGRPALSELPLDTLDPHEFENFAAHLIGELYPQADRPYLQGGRGHKQYGFDVVAVQDGRVRIAVQCKQVMRFGPAEVRKAVAAAAMSADEAFIFLSRIATPAAQEQIRSQKGWQLWDGPRLSQAVRGLPGGAAARVIDRFFPELRSDFLGLRLAGPWIEPDAYFGRAARSELYSHQWQMVGRGRELDDLAAFAAGGGGKAGLLVGRGGLGKTRMLRALCDRLSASQDLPAVFLDRDPELDARSFGLLPEGRLLVIIDDAHDDAVPAARVIAGVHAANPDANVLLALRPHGEPHARRELRMAGLDPGDTFRCELGDLMITDAESLAREVLGDRAAHYALRLAGAAHDCPLLLVAGAGLVRRGKLRPDRFEGDAGMARDFTEVLAGAVIDDMAGQSEDRAEVLHAVAALQPLRTADPGFRDALAALTGRPYDQVAPHLARLEESGFLLRRGETYRVVPDLLGDWLLARRSHGPGGTTSTRYIDRVHQAASGAALANLIVNAGRMDWQRGSAAAGLLDGLWSAVRADFDVGRPEAREALLGVLAQVAFFQPERCLEIVSQAMGHPADPGRPGDSAALPSWCSSWSVRDALCQVLRRVAYRPEFLPDAARLLWRLAGDDTRPPGHHQHHPMRVLGELAAFQPASTTEYQHRLLDCVEQWAARPPGGSRDPLEVVLPMLAPEGHQELWQPRAITFRPFLLNPAAGPVADLRARALDLAFAQLAAPDPQRALAALTAVGAALTPPRGGFGLEITAEQRAAWDPEFARILDRLEQAIRQAPRMDPVLALEVRSQLQWQAEFGSAELRAACRSVFSALPADTPHNLARALHGGPADPPADPDAAANLQHKRKALDDLFAAAITDLASLPGRQVASDIERSLRSAGELLGDDAARSRPFLFALVSARPALATAIAGHAAANPEGRLAGQTAIILIAMAAAGNPEAVPVARRLLATGNTQLARHVAHAFGIQRGRVGELLPGEAGLLRTLVTHDDGEVHAAALGALRTLGPQYRELAANLLSDAPPERPGFAWWEVAAAAGPAGRAWGTLAWDDLPDGYKDRLFGALETTARIENYETMQLLAELSREDPYRVVKLLTRRIQRAEDGAPDGYEPLPHHWTDSLSFREHPAFPDIVHQLYGWLADEPESAQRRHYGSELFTLAAGPFDAQVRSVIDRYLEAPDPARITALAAILASIPQAPVWDTDFVRRCLQAASQCGTASLDAIQDALHRSVLTGQNLGTLGGATNQAAQHQHLAAQLADQCASGSREERFYRALARSAEVWTRRSTNDWDILPDGRRW
jgi:transcriptional regulator with XRE-family HTH domain